MNSVLHQNAIPNVMKRAVASGLFVSLASFFAPDLIQGPTGNPVGTFTPVTGLQGIPCMDAPQSDIRVSSDEVRSVTDIQAGRYRHVLLNGYYPAVIAGWPLGWRVTIDGVIWDLAGAECDSQRTQTRLKLQLITI
jgi:hypothetical protein